MIERRRLPVEGQSVARCIVDYAFSLQFHGNAGYRATLRIEAPFFLTTGATRTRCDPRNPSELGAALVIFGKKISHCSFDETGSLLMEAESDKGLEIRPTGDYEAWEFSDSDGLGIVSMPSGGVDERGPQAQRVRS